MLILHSPFSRIFSHITHSKRHHQVDHALLVIALPAAEAEPLVHHAALPQAFRDSDMSPCDSVVHREGPLGGKIRKKSETHMYSEEEKKNELCSAQK